MGHAKRFIPTMKARLRRLFAAAETFTPFSGKVVTAEEQASLLKVISTLIGGVSMMMTVARAAGPDMQMSIATAYVSTVATFIQKDLSTEHARTLLKSMLVVLEKDATPARQVERPGAPAFQVFDGGRGRA